MSVAPDVLADIQAEFSREWQRLCDDARQGALPPPSDRRFAGPAWAAQGSHLLMAHAYLLSARAMSRLVDAAQVSEPLRERLRFSVMQWVDALSPSNFLALNPDAQQSIVESAGRALTEGVANLLGDVKKGRITQTDESQFEIGRNVAVTPGEVVFENRLIQLIQYAPDRDRARASAGDRAAEHQQVLHPGPAAREFLRPARGGAGLYGVPGFLAQPGVQRHRRHRSRHLVRLPGRRGAASAARGQRHQSSPRSTPWASAWAARCWLPRWPWPRRAASTRWPRSRC